MKKIELYEPFLAKDHQGLANLTDEQKATYSALFSYLKANSVHWIAQRYNLGNHPEMFVKNPKITELFNGDSHNLPLYLIDDKLVSKGTYLSLHELKTLYDLNAEDIEIIYKNAKKIITEWNDHSSDRLQDCSCV